MDINVTPEGLIFTVYAQPRASRTMVVGPFQEGIKIKITSAPVDQAANKALLAFLGKVLKLPKSRLEIVAGQNGRVKKVRIRHGQIPPDRRETEGICQAITDLTEKLF